MGKQLLVRGVGASPGSATGAVVFSSDEALALAAKGTSVVFVRIDVTPEDVPAMQVAAGIITTRGGLTGDAAIVARTLGKPCIAGCPTMHVDYAAGQATIWGDSTQERADVVIARGDVISFDGGTGEVWLG
jgi:pyruvate, orthophosphate dikinase